MANPINIHCPPSMRMHVDKVLKGEYDVRYDHPKPVIVDVGANIGSFAIWARHRWPGSVVHCYEPLPENFALLQKNLADMGQSVHLNNFAIGDPTHSRMYVGRNNCGEASFFQLGEQRTETVDVLTRPPEVLPQGQILKMDAEGAEVEILSGITPLTFDVVVLEYHSDQNRRRVDALLEDYSLVGADIRHPDRGVLKYVARRLFKTE